MAMALEATLVSKLLGVVDHLLEVLLQGSFYALAAPLGQLLGGDSSLALAPPLGHLLGGVVFPAQGFPGA